MVTTGAAKSRAFFIFGKTLTTDSAEKFGQDLSEEWLIAPAWLSSFVASSGTQSQAILAAHSW